MPTLCAVDPALLGRLLRKQCRCAAFQERLPCSHCPKHVLHAAVAGACEEQEEYLRESRHVCAPERSQTRPHTDTEHPTQPGVVDGVTGRPPRHVQRALGQHAFCPRKWHQTRAHEIDMPSRARLNPRAFTSGRRRRRAWPRRSAAAPRPQASARLSHPLHPKRFPGPGTTDAKLTQSRRPVVKNAQSY